MLDLKFVKPGSKFALRPEAMHGMQTHSGRGGARAQTTSSASVLPVYPLDLGRRALIAIVQDDVRRRTALTEAPNLDDSLLFGPFSTKNARARLDVVRGGQLTYPIANSHDPVRHPRFIQIGFQRRNGLPPLSVQVRVGHIGWGASSRSVLSARQSTTRVQYAWRFQSRGQMDMNQIRQSDPFG